MASGPKEHDDRVEGAPPVGYSGEWVRVRLSESPSYTDPLVQPSQQSAPDIASRLLMRFANDVANVGMGVEASLDALEEAQRTGASPSEHIATIRESMRRTAQYVRDVEVLLVPSVAAVTLNPAVVIESCLEDISSGEDRSRSVRGRFPLDLWAVALGPEQLEAALFHVLSNALEATREAGEVSLDAVNVIIDPARSTALGVHPGEFVRVSVRDTGIGLDPHLASRAFEPFFSTWGQDQPWRGLGLTKVKSLVEGSGGRCDLRSAAQRGTCVTLLLPKAHASAGTAPRAPVATVPAASAPEFPLSAFLIVDDEPLVSIGLARTLTRDGHSVEVARDAVEAASIIDGGTAVDIAVVDWHLGSTSGIDVARAIRDKHPETTVLLTTGYVETMLAESASEAESPFPVLRKPFTTQDLLDAVQQARKQLPPPNNGRS